MFTLPWIDFCQTKYWTRTNVQMTEGWKTSYAIQTAWTLVIYSLSSFLYLFPWWSGSRRCLCMACYTFAVAAGRVFSVLPSSSRCLWLKIGDRWGRGSQMRGMRWFTFFHSVECWAFKGETFFFSNLWHQESMQNQGVGGKCCLARCSAMVAWVCVLIWRYGWQVRQQKHDAKKNLVAYDKLYVFLWTISDIRPPCLAHSQMRRTHNTTSIKLLEVVSPHCATRGK